MLRLSFLTLGGEPPTLMLARCVRFAADGTLRGPDNSVIARCLEGAWQVGGRMHRELECEGPVRVRLSFGPGEPARVFGPFQQLRTRGGVLYGDDACLNISLPGRLPGGAGIPSALNVTFDRGRDEEP